MTIRVGEIGKELYVGTDFDLSSNTELTIKFESPDSETVFERTKTSDGITAPAVDSPSIPGVGILLANTYMLYETQALDFIAGAGEWCISARYTEGSSKFYIGAPATLVISAEC